MAADQLWVSHSSISDFLNCPKLYFYRNVYKDPLTGRRITRIEPALALGQVVHEVIDAISVLPVAERLSVSLSKRFETEWEKVLGKKGGFKTKEQEEEYKARGLAMVERISENPGPVARKAIKINSEDTLPPRYLISAEENILLCGKVDWLEYIESADSVHIIDFKTGKWDVDNNSLQLPIYYLIAKNLQKRAIEGASYWYLDREDEPRRVELPAESKAREEILAIAKRIKLARALSHFSCASGGCKYCYPYELIAKGKGEKVGENSYQDIYVI